MRRGPPPTMGGGLKRTATAYTALPLVVCLDRCPPNPPAACAHCWSWLQR